MDYDSLGNLLYASDPNRGEHWSYYDAQGKVTAMRDGRYQEQHFVYDGASRITHTYYKTVPEEQQGQLPSLVSSRLVHQYQYDSASSSEQTNLAGQVASVRDEAGVSRFGYDARGRQILHQRKMKGSGIDTPFYQMRQVFDSADRLTQYTYADGSTLNYSYDASGQLASVENVVDTIDYHPSGQLSGVRLSNGVEIKREFDARQRLVDQTSFSPQVTFEKRHYVYGPDSNLTQIEDNLDVAAQRLLATQLATNAVNLNQDASFVYDAYARLTQADTATQRFQYRYDEIGNLLNKKVGQSEFITFTYGGRDDGTGRENRLGYQGAFSAEI